SSTCLNNSQYALYLGWTIPLYLLCVPSRTLEKPQKWKPLYVPSDETLEQGSKPVREAHPNNPRGYPPLEKEPPMLNPIPTRISLSEHNVHVSTARRLPIFDSVEVILTVFFVCRVL